ncbi:MAG: hypothetical protein ABIE36_03635 [Candidatus Diapherotrites archaeon]
MAECFRCGISDERELLFDAISNKGVIKICKKCNEEEEFPLIERDYPNKPEKTKTVYERLSLMAHLDAEKHRNRIKEREELLRRQKQDKTLRDIVDENFNNRVAIKSKPRIDLVENFHWILMRSRRGKKITQKQLAENIGESELAIKMAEEGFMTDNSDTLVKKLENYFKIKLFREDFPSSLNPSAFAKTGIKEIHDLEDPLKQKIKEDFGKEASFDSNTAKILTISDLQEIKKKKEAEGTGIFSFLRRSKKEKEKTENLDNKRELSNDEANEILFGEN